MSGTARLHPSNHQFPVEGMDSILQAGLKAGYRLDYGCSNGNCGDCKARLLGGEIEPIRAHDHAFSEQEKADGVFLMCCHTARGHIELETAEAETPDAIPTREIMARVRKVEPAGETTLILNLKTPRTERLRFLAGQHITLALGVGGKMGPEADFPIASCPCDDMRIQLHVAVDPTQPFSNYLTENINHVDQALIRGPQGLFVLDDDSKSPLFFIAVDEGFAPVRSLVEHAMSLENTEIIHLVWFATKPGGHYMKNLIRSWADVLDGFCYTLCELGPGETVGAALPHALVTHDISVSGDGDGRFATYVAGPQAALGGIEAALTESGLPLALLHVDSLA